MRRRAERGPIGERHTLTIEAIGGKGDGRARLDGRVVHVPYTLPGERVRLRIVDSHAGGLDAVVEARLDGPVRADPPCPHFGACGGCALQHVPDAGYRAWKIGRITEALARRGLHPPEIRPLAISPPGSRRRARLVARFDGEVVRLGLRARRSRAVVDLDVCPVLRPALVALLPGLRSGLAGLLPRGGTAELLVTEGESGAELLMQGPLADLRHGQPGLAARERLAELADRLDLARLLWRARPDSPPEPIALRRPFRVVIAGFTLEPPPAAFLQATIEGEAALQAAVRQAVDTGAAKAKDRPGSSAPPGQMPSDDALAELAIADLHAGQGTLSLPLLARGARVHAVERDPDVLAALARAAPSGGRLTTETRDLVRAPLSPAELARFDAVLLDPPRAGAREQAAILATAPIPRVVMASCAPASFARDARLLVDGGLRLVRLWPVDQFLWSPAVELVALFVRDHPHASPS